MAKLLSNYWNKFIDVDEDGNEKGNGVEFENLVKYLLNAMYGTRWKRTGGSHDHNRDFWIHLSEQSIWAECKNYKDTIAMNVLAPTLVMAQIYEVNEILFFSRSDINKFAKDKILAFGEKSNKMIRFFDGCNLEDLICNYASKLPKKYSPLKYIDLNNPEKSEISCVSAYFLRNTVSNVQNTAEFFQNYETIESIYYNETFALTFCLMNSFQEDLVEVFIEFMDESDERFSFQYFYPTIVPEKRQWYHAYLKKGEGRSVSLNMRHIVYKPFISLPKFHISFKSSQNDMHFDWYSKEIIVKSNWVGVTRLIGNNYFKILDQTKDRLVNNPYLSNLIITGSSGTGKTRILAECQNIFLKNGYHIISLSGQENFSSHYFLKEIVSFLYEIPSDDVLKLLEEKIFSDNSECTSLEHTEVEKALNLLKIIINSSTEEALQEVLDKYADILYEKLSKNKNVLIIDNMQYAGKAFQNFIEHYVYYGVNQQSVNQSVLMLVFNTDYMTPISSELLYNLLHSNIRHCLSFPLIGFIEKEQGIEFLQELTRTNEDKNKKYFSEIIKKVSLKPYNLLQTTKFLEESDIIQISPNKEGYIISNLEKYDILSNISNGIISVLEKRLQFIHNDIPYERLMHIFSIVYIFDSIEKYIQEIFNLCTSELDYLCKKNILRLQKSEIYIFDHDIIRNFFFMKYPQHVLNCLVWLQKEGSEKEIKRYRTVYLLYKIAIEKDVDIIINTGRSLSDISIPERMASIFYNRLLDAFVELLENQNYVGIYIKYIHQICTYIRQYDGSERAWQRGKEIYDIIQTNYPKAMSEDIEYYRPFIHFCCDIAVQTHLYEEEVMFIKDVLSACKTASPLDIKKQDELNVLQAIMYNRWYISYNTESYKKEFAEKRHYLMKKSKIYGDAIVDPSKKGLIEYLNNSDEGYNYYGYYKDKEQLFSIWDKCIIDIPKLVPEKTLNYYRKKVQYGLIEQNANTVEEETRKALEYLGDGEYSHEPIIFKTFFLMAEVMSNIQHNPEKMCYYNAGIIDHILKMQQLLNNHKLGDILLLKGVNAHYAGNKDEVYYSYKEAYKQYDAGETSRYWIKKDLLEENIKYSFTVLGIYKAGYDVSCFPIECRQPIVLFEGVELYASGIQRTGDLHLNLPLI